MITIAIDCGASFLKGAKLIGNKIERIVLKEAPCAKKTGEIFKAGQINSVMEAHIRTMFRGRMNSGIL